MTFVSLGISAQLKVYSDGSMTLDRDTSFTGSRFTVGNIPTIVSNIPIASPENIGIYGIATTQASDLINSSIEINGQTVIVGNTTITVSNSN